MTIHKWQVGYSGSNHHNQNLIEPPDHIYPVPQGYKPVGPWEPFGTQTLSIMPAPDPVLPVNPYHLLVWRRPLTLSPGGAP